MKSENPSGDEIAAVVNAQRRMINVLLFFGVLATIPEFLPMLMGFLGAAGDGFGQSLKLTDQIAKYVIPLWGLFFLYSVGKLAYVLDGAASAAIHCLALLIPPLGFCLLMYLNSRASYHVLPFREDGR